MPPGRARHLSALLVAALGGALAQQDAPPSPFGVSLPFLPARYSERFASGPVDGFAGGGRFGVRRLPLPLPVDVRLTLGRVPAGMEAGLEVRAQDTSAALGVFEPSVGADETLPRVPRFQVIHNPAGGVQAGVNLQGAGFLSETHLGYAQRVDALGLRVLGEVGFGVQASARSPFAHLEASAGRHGDAGTLHWNAAVTARAFVFPTQWQRSLDLTGSLTWRPVADQDLTVSAGHFERLSWGTVALPDLNVAPDRVTTLSASYQPPPQQGVLRLDGVSFTYTRHWLSPADNAAPLAATFSVNFGASTVALAPRHDFMTGEWGVGATYLYRFGRLAVGPRLDVRRLAGATTWTVGVAVGQ